MLAGFIAFVKAVRITTSNAVVLFPGVGLTHDTEGSVGPAGPVEPAGPVAPVAPFLPLVPLHPAMVNRAAKPNSKILLFISFIFPPLSFRMPTVYHTKSHRLVTDGEFL